MSLREDIGERVVRLRRESVNFYRELGERCGDIDEVSVRSRRVIDELSVRLRGDIGRRAVRLRGVIGEVPAGSWGNIGESSMRFRCVSLTSSVESATGWRLATAIVLPFCVGSCGVRWLLWVEHRGDLS